MNIIELSIENFAGITNEQIFPGDKTILKGPNGSGKSSAGNAISWLLTGKNMHGETDFPAKQSGATECTVTADFYSFTLSKILREKWTRRRGKEATFSGHETFYSIDGVYCKKSDFEKFINENIIEIDKLELLLTPDGFVRLPWRKQREILSQMVNEESDYAIAQEQFPELVERLKNNSLDDVRKSLQSNRTKTNKEIEAIPQRIDEKKRERVDQAAIDEAKKRIEQIDEEIDSLDSQISSESTEMQKYNKQKNDLYKQIDMLQHELDQERKSIREQEREQRDKKGKEIANKIEELNKSLTEETKMQRDSGAKLRDIQANIEQLNKSLEDCRSKYKEVSNWSIEPEHEWLNCPTCERPYEDADPEELRKSLNKRKSDELERLRKEGEELKQQLEKNKGRCQTLQFEFDAIGRKIDSLSHQKRELEKQYDNIEVQVDKSKHDSLISDIEQVQQELNNMKQPDEPDKSELKQKRTELNNERDTLMQTASHEKHNESVDKRVQELNQKHAELTQSIADTDKLLDQINQLTEIKVERINNRIAGWFAPVSFKMYDKQVNGELRETCEAIMNDRTLSEMSTGERIKAGISIVDALTTFYQVRLPLLIDNAECLTGEVPVKGQSFWMVAAENDKLEVKKFIKNIW